MLPLTKRSFFILILLLTCLGCGKQPPFNSAALKIDDYTLTAEEFNKLFSELVGVEDTPQSREAFLNVIIDRKILLQEAQNQGLDKEEDFLRSIENFWEQSLLKVIIERKTGEIIEASHVTEQEVKDYYAKWALENPESQKTYEELRDVMKWQLVNEKESLVMQTWLEQLKARSHIEINKEALGIK